MQKILRFVKCILQKKFKLLTFVAVFLFFLFYFCQSLFACSNPLQSCIKDADCCGSGACLSGVCKQPIGTACSNMDECEGNNVYCLNGTCQRWSFAVCSRLNSSCYSPNQCCGDVSSLSCMSGTCSWSLIWYGVPQANGQLACSMSGGNSVFKTDYKQCADGSKIYLSYYPDGNGFCGDSTNEPGVYNKKRCCDGDPSNCLSYTQHIDANDCQGCTGANVYSPCPTCRKEWGVGCFNNGQGCTQNSDCCNGVCNANGICGPNCSANGFECAWNSDCCSAYCRPEAPRICMDPPPVPSCAIQNLSCPTTCTIGQNFNVSYDFRNTDYTTKPNISQRLANSGYNTLWCLADQTYNDNSWHSAVRTIPCTGTTDIVRVGGNSSANHWTDWCSYSWADAQIGSGFGCYGGYCSVTPVSGIPSAIGYVKIKHPLGILSLRLISFSDALSFLKGIFKVARFNGDTNASADLVETTDPNASPVRIKTPYGIKAWRMQR